MDKNKDLIKETEEYREKICDLLKGMNIDKLKYYYAYIMEYEKE